jgi:hypothetical protein
MRRNNTSSFSSIKRNLVPLAPRPPCVLAKTAVAVPEQQQIQQQQQQYYPYFFHPAPSPSPTAATATATIQSANRNSNDNGAKNGTNYVNTTSATCRNKHASIHRSHSHNHVTGDSHSIHVTGQGRDQQRGGNCDENANGMANNAKHIGSSHDGHGHDHGSWPNAMLNNDHDHEHEFLVRDHASTLSASDYAAAAEHLKNLIPSSSCQKINMFEDEVVLDHKQRGLLGINEYKSRSSSSSKHRDSSSSCSSDVDVDRHLLQTPYTAPYNTWYLIANNNDNDRHKHNVDSNVDSNMDSSQTSNGLSCGAHSHGHSDAGPQQAGPSISYSYDQHALALSSPRSRLQPHDHSQHSTAASSSPHSHSPLAMVKRKRHVNAASALDVDVMFTIDKQQQHNGGETRARCTSRSTDGINNTTVHGRYHCYAANANVMVTNTTSSSSQSHTSRVHDVHSHSSMISSTSNRNSNRKSSMDASTGRCGSGSGSTNGNAAKGVYYHDPNATISPARVLLEQQVWPVGDSGGKLSGAGWATTSSNGNESNAAVGDPQSSCPPGARPIGSGIGSTSMSLAFALKCPPPLCCVAGAPRPPAQYVVTRDKVSKKVKIVTSYPILVTARHSLPVPRQRQHQHQRQRQRQHQRNSHPPPRADGDLSLRQIPPNANMTAPTCTRYYASNASTGTNMPDGDGHGNGTASSLRHHAVSTAPPAVRRTLTPCAYYAAQPQRQQPQSSCSAPATTPPIPQTAYSSYYEVDTTMYWH